MDKLTIQEQANIAEYAVMVGLSYAVVERLYKRYGNSVIDSIFTMPESGTVLLDEFWEFFNKGAV